MLYYYVLLQNKLSFLGVEISENGINTDPNKTETLRCAEAPQNIN